MGFSNFYRRFIRGYSAVIEPLTRLLRKDVTWTWSRDQTNAFSSLKKSFTQAPILAYFDYQKHTVVETDASNWASGGALLQKGDDDLLHPVAFFSSKHSPAESNYGIYDKELLAIIKSLEEWRPELAGVQRPFEIITDHKNLKTFITAKQLNQRQMRWSEFLSQFDFTITYRPGSNALIPDTLSRLPGLQPKDSSDERLRNRFRSIIPEQKVNPNLFQSSLRLENNDDSLNIPSRDISLIDLIHQAYRENKSAKAIVKSLHNISERRWPKALRSIIRKDKIEFKVNNGLAYFRDRLFVPDNENLRLEIVHRCHSSGPAGHPRRVKTLDLIQRTY